MRTTWQRGLAGVVAGAQLLLASPGFAAPTLGAGTTDIGVAGAVAGRVARTNQQIVGEIVASGKPIYLGDQIDTEPAGRLQVLLRDETVFTIGPSSSLVIDEFVYDPQQHTGKLAARAIKGTFRFVSGQIARTRPADMEVRLPTGVIGIRGTIVAGRIDGDKCRIVLLGPGVQNNAGERPGQITVANTINGRLESVLLTRPGYGTEIPGANLPPTPPAPVPPAELQALTQSLESAPPPAAPDPTPPPPGEPTATEYSGQDLIAALLSLFGVESLTELSTDLTDESNTAVQKAADTNTKIADGISTLDQLRTIDTGVFHYAFVGPVGSFVQTKKFGSPSSINGTIEAHINIDFGARTIGGNIGSSTSHVVADTSSFGGSIFADDTIEAQSFATGSGNAVFTDTNTSGLTGSLTLNNKDGVVAATATGQVTYSDTISGGNEGSASAFTVDRQSGAAP